MVRGTTRDHRQRASYSRGRAKPERVLSFPFGEAVSYYVRTASTSLRNTIQQIEQLPTLSFSRRSRLGF